MNFVNSHHLCCFRNCTPTTPWLCLHFCAHWRQMHDLPMFTQIRVPNVSKHHFLFCMVFNVEWLESLLSLLIFTEGWHDNLRSKELKSHHRRTHRCLKASQHQDTHKQLFSPHEAVVPRRSARDNRDLQKAAGLSGHTLSTLGNEHSAWSCFDRSFLNPPWHHGRPRFPGFRGPDRSFCPQPSAGVSTWTSAGYPAPKLSGNTLLRTPSEKPSQKPFLLQNP